MRFSEFYMLVKWSVDWRQFISETLLYAEVVGTDMLLFIAEIRIMIEVAIVTIETGECFQSIE